MGRNEQVACAYTLHGDWPFISRLFSVFRDNEENIEKKICVGKSGTSLIVIVYVAYTLTTLLYIILFPF